MSDEPETIDEVDLKIAAWAIRRSATHDACVTVEYSLGRVLETLNKIERIRWLRTDAACSVS
jgi:hypothetical protein